MTPAHFPAVRRGGGLDTSPNIDTAKEHTISLIDTFQDLVAQVPEIVQPLIVALAGAVPFIEGEGAAGIGIIGGINPVVAVIAGVLGNFICVVAVVMLGSGARRAVVTRRRGRAGARSLVTAGATAPGTEPHDTQTIPGARDTARTRKFQTALSRYGVPGVSLLGPLLLPTQFTATMLAASGVSTRRVLLWQAIAIVGWSTIVAVLLSGVVSVVG